MRVLTRSALLATCIIGIGPMLFDRSYSAGEIVVADSPALSDLASASPEAVIFASAPLAPAKMTFQMQVSGRATDLCAEAPGSFELSETYRSDNGDECYWRLDLVRPSAETCPSAEQHSDGSEGSGCYTIPTLYFFASSTGGWITTVRYRLNAMSGPLGNGLRIMRRVAETMFKAHGWSMPAAEAGDIESGTKASWQAGGAEYVFLREDDTSPRFDLLVRFPPLASLDSDPQVMRQCNANKCNYVLVYP